MKKLFFAMALLAAIGVSAQKKFSIEANYPMPIGGNFLNEYYKGVADVGVKWAFVSLPVVRIGVGANAGYYKWDGDTIPDPFKAYIFQPKAFAEFSFEPVVSLHPSVALGYTTIVFNGGGDTNSRSGVNYNVGLAYDIIGGLFVQVQYDAITLKKEDNFGSNANILKAGVGIRF